MLTLTLFVPGLPPADDAHSRLAAQPALYGWLCRGRLELQRAIDADAALAAWFGLADCEELPHAALCAIGAGIDPLDAVWLHADPVHLHAQRTELVLVDAARLELDASESRALVDALNAHFTQDALRLHVLSPSQWIVQSQSALHMRTVALSAAAGRNVDPLLPRGADALLWHRRSNEAQMLLHAHPVNAAREARGAPAINSVWWWGVGRAPTCVRAFDVVWGEGPFLHGLARCAGAATRQLPPDAAVWLGEAVPGQHLAVLGHGSFGTHEDTATLETKWIAPLADAVKQGRIESVTLATFAHGQRAAWRLTRADLWKLWRRHPQLPRPWLGHTQAQDRA